MVKLFLVDDDKHWLEGLEWLLNEEDDFTVIGQSHTVAQTVTVLKMNLDIDVVLLDIKFNNRNQGIALVSDIRSSWPDARIVMLSSDDNGEMIFEAFKVGASDYVVKTSMDDIVKTVRAAYNGEAGFHSPAAAEALKNHLFQMGQQETLSTLTKQERRVLALVYQDLSAEEIQSSLRIEEHTYHNHITNARRKLYATSRTEAAKKAKQLGLLNDFL